MVLFFTFFVVVPAQAIPTGTGGENFPLGSDAGDDLNVGSGKLVVEGDTGNVGIGTAAPTSKLHVVADTSQASGFFLNTVVEGAQTAASTGSYYGLNVAPTYTASSGTLAGLLGVQGYARNLSSGTVNNLFGVTGIATNGSSGAVGEAFSFYGRVENTGAGTTTNAFGVYVATPVVSAGAITNKYALVTEAGAGNVGIGTATPASFARLHVVYNASGYSALFANEANTTTAHGVAISPVGSDTTGGANVMAFFRPDGTGIGSISQNTATTVGYNTASDERLKKGIQNTRYGLSDLMNIKVRDYRFIHDPEEVPQTGFIAQELHEVFPNAVTVGGEDPKKEPWGVDYGRLTPLLVKAVQDQEVEIARQSSQIDQLRAELEELKRR